MAAHLALLFLATAHADHGANNAATFIYDGGEVTFPKQSKRQLADSLISQIPDIFASQLADTNPETVTQ